MDVIFGSDPVYRALHKPPEIGIPEGRIMSTRFFIISIKGLFEHLLKSLEN